MKNRSFTVVLDKYTGPIESENLVAVPAPVFEHLGCMINAKLKLGTMELDITCLPNGSQDRLQLSWQLFKILGLPEGIILNAVAINQRLCLGPVIAVFSSNGSIKKANAQNASFRLEELANANKRANTMLYFFSIKDVDFIRRKIRGTFFNEKTGTWQQRYLPFPDILYDRGGGVLSKQKIVSDYIRSQLIDNLGVKRINCQHYFDKWDMHQKLSRFKEVQHHLPATLLYESLKDLKFMFQGCSILYLKDCCGSNGRGIMRVKKDKGGIFSYNYFNDGIVEGQANSLDELDNRIRAFFRKKRIIIQNAIDVIKVDDSNVDLRATVQRNGQGRLEVSAYPVRVGKPGCPITSTKSGSKVYIFEEFFKNIMGYSDNRIIRVKEAATAFLFAVFKAMERAYGDFGELGIDFAIDREGKFWFIECNAKPGKDTVYLSYDRDTVTKVFLNPLEYGKHICGYGS
ncbi:MAG: YheC/YheD family protein [Mahellales bacterium]